MIKKIPLPNKYHFLINKKFLLNFFKKIFLGKKVKIEKIKINSIEMSGSLKIFLQYFLTIGREKKFFHAIYRFSGTQEKEFQILKYLFNFNFPVPQPLFYFKKEKVLFYEDLLGVPLSEIKKEKILKILKEIIPSLVSSLFFLHKVKPPVPKYDLKEDFQKFKIFEKEFKKFLPEEKNLIEKLIFKVFKEKKFYLKKIGFPNFLHNDLTFGNIILLKNKKIGFIDFSRSCFYDPISDVSTFLSQLDYLLFLMPKRNKEISKIQGEFVNSYLKLAKGYLPPSKDIGERLSLFRAYGNLKNAIFILGAEERFQNPKGCLWFLRMAEKNLKIFS